MILNRRVSKMLQEGRPGSRPAWIQRRVESGVGASRRNSGLRMSAGSNSGGAVSRHPLSGCSRSENARCVSCLSKRPNQTNAGSSASRTGNAGKLFGRVSVTNSARTFAPSDSSRGRIVSAKKAANASADVLPR